MTQVINIHDEQYIWGARRILECGDYVKGRNGGAYSLTGLSSTYDLRAGFPLLTTKKVNFGAVVAELIWFIGGECWNVKTLDSGIWDQWARSDGYVGPIYGVQWRDWRGDKPREVDQLTQAIDAIKEGPTRRALVSAWNVTDLPDMAIPPCHFAFQLHRYDFNGYPPQGWLDLTLYQRSADWCVGVPFNIASYALLAHLIANECSLTPRYLHCHYGDAHVYEEHVGSLREQVARPHHKPPELAPLPCLKPVVDIEKSDIAIEDYSHEPFIRYEVKK